MTAADPFDPVQAILAADAPVVLLTGPAGAGKTAAALGLYAHHDSRADQQPPCLLLGPNRAAVTQLRRRLLAGRTEPVLLGPGAITFDDLAGRILLAGRRPHRALSQVRRTILIESILRRLAESDQLHRLAALVEAPGLVGAVDRAIAELKRAGVAPEDLLAAMDQSPPGRLKDLHAIYAAYQRHLQQHELYDTEGKMWQAELTLAAMDTPALPGLRTLVVDGFTDFTPTQLKILSRLSDQLDRLVITLCVADDGRGRLWHWTTRQLGRITAAFGPRCRRIELPSQPERLACGAALPRVFRPVPSPAASAEGVRLVEAEGHDTECRAIARWVKTHLAAGVPPEELLIVSRTSAGYAEALSRIFAEARLPAPPPPQSLAERPVGRFALALAQLAAEADAERLLAVLASSLLYPPALGNCARADCDVAAMMVRAAGVAGGRDALRDALSGLIERVALAAPEGEDEPEHFHSQSMRWLSRLGPDGLTRAAALVDALLESLEPLSARQTPAAHAAALAEMLSRLAVEQAMTGPDELLAATLRDLDRLRALLEELADPAPDERSAGPGELTAELARLMQMIAAPGHRALGAAPLVDALDARALSARHVWLAGVNDGTFPAPAGESALIAEADRTAWRRRRNLPLDARDDLVAREMLLMYLCLARASESVTVSWLASDDAGRAAQRSPFVTELMLAAGLTDAAIERFDHTQHAPPDGQIISPRELRNAGMLASTSPADSDGLGRRSAALAALRSQSPERLADLAWPIWIAHRRWRAGPSDQYDGVLDDPALLELLARRVQGSAFSASQLTCYAGCPWQYFARYVLALEPLPEIADELLPRQRGLMVHAVLQEALSDAGEQIGPIALADLARPEVLEAVDRACRKEYARGLKMGVSYPDLWAREVDSVRAAAVRYLQRAAADADLRGAVRCSELSFGMDMDPDADPQSSPEPIVLSTPAGPVRLRGRIDRVDQVETDDGPVLRVVDYKTGRPPTLTQDLQLPLYLIAAERMFELPGGAMAFHQVRGRGPCHDAESSVWDGSSRRATPGELVESALTRTGKIVEGIAAGNFDALAAHQCAAGQCPYRRICGYSPTRQAIKAPPEPEADPR